MKNGWQRINGRWYGFGGPNDGAAYTGWQLINNNWYYFNDDGEARTGWQTINGHRYYFDSTNAWALKGWQVLNNDWYYFDNNNAWALTGWQTINGQRYYFDPTNYQMVTGTYSINGDYYFFSPSGSQQKGLVYNPATGSLQYYDLVTGVRQNSAIVNGQTLYFNSTTGDLDLNNLADGLNKLGNNHYFKSNNRLVANTWETGKR